MSSTIIFSKSFSIVIVIDSLLILVASTTTIILQITWAQQIIIPSKSTIDRNPSNIDPLPTWNYDLVKQRIMGFVQNATDSTNVKHYIPAEDRIAVFDNDETL